MGGLKDFSLMAASTWVSKHVGEHDPLDTYCMKDFPGDSFNGLLFIKFGSSKEASSALTLLKGKVFAENFGKEFKEQEDKLMALI